MFYIGADYYPEDWDEELIEWDIEKLKENGFNVVRLGEFAWSKDEPRDGEFDFTWLHRVVDRLGEAGIKVIMGTPTPTPPAWLYFSHPEIAQINTDGTPISHGGREHACHSNPVFKKYCARLVEEMGREFGSDKNIIGWQLDNEIYPREEACVCPHCMERFHKHLENKFGTIENLNKQWNLTLFSQQYDSFDQIPAPFGAWHNPHIKQEWKISQGQNKIDFIAMQADILHKYVSVPIGTDTMPFNGMNYRKMEEKLDVCQFNHYNTEENEDMIFFWFDYLRKFSKRPFWNTETEPCWNGSTCHAMSVHKDNFIYFNTMLPFILGGEAVLFWLWRSHWAGHELMHGAVYESCGRPTYANAEIRQASSDIRRLEPLLEGRSVVSECAVTFSSVNYIMQENQDISHTLRHKYCDWDNFPFYKAMLNSGMHADVIDLEENIDSYKLIFSPLCFTLEEGDFEERITKWVNNGGVWIVGPLTDIRNKYGAKYKTSPYGFLEKLTGAYQKYDAAEVTPYTDIAFENNEGDEVKCARNFELFDDNNGESLITVKRWHSALTGLACAKLYSVGKGKVIILGTFPEDKELNRILKLGAALANVITDDATDMLITRFKGEKDTLTVLGAYTVNPGAYRFDGSKKDRMTGKIYNGSITLEPFRIAVLEDIQ